MIERPHQHEHGSQSCCPPDPKSTGVLKYVFDERSRADPDHAAQMFHEAEPEIVERLNELVDAMGMSGLKPSSSAVLALFTMGLALLLNQGYDRQKAFFVVQSLLPFADHLKDQLLSPVADPREGE